jgi:hypothetical protein
MRVPSIRPLVSVVGAVVCAVAIHAAAQSPRPAPANQSPLSDQAFWTLVGDLSETDGDFHADNFTSNEAFADHAATLAARPPGGAYLGVGPEQNFSYIVATRPEVAFVIDVRRQALIQHLLFKALFELSADRAEFIARLFSRPKAPGPSDRPLQQIWDTMPPASAGSDRYQKNHDEVVQHLTATHGFALSAAELTMLDYVHGAFFKLGPAINYIGFPSTRASSSGNTDFTKLSLSVDQAGVARSFLASEANFRIVKALQAKNLVIPVQGDFGGPKTIRAIGQFLRDRQLRVNAFYISNVEQYLFGSSSSPTIDINGGWRAFYANLATLPIDNTSLIVRWPSGAQNAAAAGVAICPIAVFLKLVEGGTIQRLADVRTCGTGKTAKSIYR